MRPCFAALVSVTLLGAAHADQGAGERDHRRDRHRGLERERPAVQQKAAPRPGDPDTYAPKAGAPNPYATQGGAPNPYATRGGDPPRTLPPQPARRSQPR